MKVSYNNPIFVSPDGQDYECIGWACDAFKSGWEWFAFKVAERDGDGIYYGLVYGFETEWGYFSADELKDCGIKFYTNPRDLQTIMPPQKWTKLKRD